MYASRCVGGVRVSCAVFYIIAIVAIFVYGYFVRETGRPDVLGRNVTDDPAWDNCDGWAITHLLFWCFLGFWFPGRYAQALGFSLGWEAFEDFLGRTRIPVGGSRLQLVGETDEETQIPKKDKEFWYGRYATDTFYNLAGYIFGSALAGRLWPADACRCARCGPGAAAGQRA